MTASSTVALEGITLQLAGELLTDTVSPHGQTTTGREAYLQALEDFAFAVTLSDSFSAARKTKGKHNQNPGMALIDRFDSCFRHIENSIKNPSPEDSMDPASPMQPQLASDLAQLDRSLNLGRSDWESYILRESFSYLGNDDSLSGSDPQEYVFSKRFFHNPELQNAIPDSFVAQLAAHVDNAANPDDVHLPALHEFVRRSVLTHVGIFVWYEYCRALQPNKDTIALPFPTRATVLSQRDPHTSQIERATVPYILALALDGSRTRTQFFDMLLALRTNSAKIGGIRKLVTEALFLLNDGKPQRIDKLLATIQQETERFHDGTSPPDTVTVQTSAVWKGVTVKTSFASDAITRILNRPKYFVRRLITSSREAIQDRVHTQLSKVFPELYQNGK